MAKRKKKLLEGQPMPLEFHPKDTPDGLMWRPGNGFGAVVSHRNTVIISVGGPIAEVTVERAKRFAEQLACAIRCAESPETQEGKHT